MVCLLWDSSLSCSVSYSMEDYDQLNFITKLEQKHKQKNEQIIFTIYSFSTDLIKLSEESSPKQAKSILSKILVSFSFLRLSPDFFPSCDFRLFFFFFSSFLV